MSDPLEEGEIIYLKRSFEIYYKKTKAIKYEWVGRKKDINML